MPANADSGLIDFGSHTHSHECFLGRPDEFRSDLEASLDYLDRELGIEARLSLSRSGLPVRKWSRSQIIVVDSRRDNARQSITGRTAVLISGVSVSSIATIRED